MSTAALSLYQLDIELAGLLEFRMERLCDTQSPASAEELEAVDGAIREYMEQLPRKVDGVAGFIHQQEDMVDAADKAIARAKVVKQAAQDNIARVKEYCAVVLEKQPEPKKGCRKLAGSHSTISLKGNGGLHPLHIDGWDKDADRWIDADPGMLPDELCAWVAPRMSSELVSLVQKALFNFGEDGLRFMRVIRRIPYPSLIRDALSQPCPTCDGSGEERSGVCHCGQSMEGPNQCDNHSSVEMVRECVACGGSGRASVPGAHLEPRSFRVEVR